MAFAQEPEIVDFTEETQAENPNMNHVKSPWANGSAKKYGSPKESFMKDSMVQEIMRMDQY